MWLVTTTPEFSTCSNSEGGAGQRRNIISSHLTEWQKCGALTQPLVLKHVGLYGRPWESVEPAIGKGRSPHPADTAVQRAPVTMTWTNTAYVVNIKIPLFVA